MKYQIIYKVDYALIVSKEEIKKGDYYIHKQMNSFRMLQSVGSLLPMDSKKVIAHRPLNNAPILNGVPFLPKWDKEYEHYKIAEEMLKSHPDFKAEGMSEYQNGRYNGLIDGFERAKEIYKYTEEDLRKAFQAGESRWGTNGLIDTELNEDEFIQSLQQPKRPKYFECEMAQMNLDEIRENGKGFLHTNTEKMVTMTNAQGQTELVGKYTF